MTAPITIDTTLISGVISAAVAILVACGTVIWTTKSNRKLEEKKLKDAKKEELYLSIIDMERAMYLYFVCVSHSFNKIEYNIDVIDAARDKAIAKMELITTVHFIELGIERAMEAISQFELSYVYYLRDGFKREFSASDVVNATTLYRNIERETTALKAEVMKL
ncbi:MULTISPECIES: hypothetical protein [Serratia]|uniref:hypothetical protein n=1 Tax=Serratia TaxID=613 RepID=UPI0011C93B78|nr:MULTISPECIES: hypothetical protein [Serratia]TXE70878.1 hypothetical protein FOT59_18335 [Serratia nevei]TYR93646.1 hypothetical protein FYK38_00340 [Serratia marcescens]